MLDIIVDHREARSPVWQALHNNPQVRVEVRELPCADYLPHPDFGVERKNATDFVVSIMDRRLFSQVRRMKDEYSQALFIIEGDPYSTRSGIAPDAVRGALGYLMTIEKVSLMMVRDATETSALLVLLARQLQEGLGYEVALRANKPKDLTDLAQYLIEGLPGIGPSTARVLLKHFGSAHLVFTASVEQLCGVPGIGKKTAQRMYDALHALVPQ